MDMVLSFVDVWWRCLRSAGPKRSTLHSMLANLGSEEDLPVMQTGSDGPPRGQANDVDVEDEMEQPSMLQTN